jgi:uncharacterized DUF497 family protein
MSLVFEWDNEKAISNANKYGITFDEAKSVFYDNFAIMAFDTEHSITEERFSLIGYSKNNRLLFISYTVRIDIIRIISTRKTTKNERFFYEKKYKNN